MSIRSVCAVLTAVVGLTISSVSAMDVGLGLKGGLNLARPWGNDEENRYELTKMRPGMVIGAALELKLAKAFAIQPEVLFSSKGEKAEVDDDNYDSKSIKYIEIPVLFEVLIPAGDIVTPMIYAGPALSFRVGVSGKYALEGKEQDYPDDEIDEIKDATKGIDFGIAMGAGLGIKAGPGKLVIDARYTLGLLNVVKLTDEEEAYYDEAGEDKPVERNMDLSFMLGYMFEF